MPNALKGNAVNSGIQIGGWTVRFSSRSQHHGPDLHSERNLWEILLEIWQRPLCMLCWFRKSIWSFHRDKLWRVLQKYGNDGQLLPEVCVRVKGKQLKLFHVGVGLR